MPSVKNQVKIKNLLFSPGALYMYVYTSNSYVQSFKPGSSLHAAAILALDYMWHHITSLHGNAIINFSNMKGVMLFMITTLT